MRGIAELHDASSARRPLGLRIAPHQFPVVDFVVRRCFDDSVDDRVPFFNNFQCFFIGRCLGPALCGGTVFVLIIVSMSGIR